MTNGTADLCNEYEKMFSHIMTNIVKIAVRIFSVWFSFSNIFAVVDFDFLHYFKLFYLYHINIFNKSISNLY